MDGKKPGDVVKVMVLAHCSPNTLEPYRHPNLGVLCSPRCTYGTDIERWRWAADNDAFGAWDETKYVKMLRTIRGRKNCLFVTAPDVVGDAGETLSRFFQWRDRIRDSWQPLGYVGQDGQENLPVPWDAFDALFIGGSTEWKMGTAAHELVTEAKRRHKWVHMGRVNSAQRMKYAKAIGCDSIDGTSVSMFRDTHLLDRLAQAAAPQQGILV